MPVTFGGKSRLFHGAIRRMVQRQPRKRILYRGANRLFYLPPLMDPSAPHRARRYAQRRSSFARAHPRFEAWTLGEEWFADYLGEPWLRY
jgi:hypothetical protein